MTHHINSIHDRRLGNSQQSPLSLSLSSDTARKRRRKENRITHSNATTMTTTTSPEDVLVYVPNLIGYGRVVCTLGSLTIMLLIDNDDGSDSSSSSSSSSLLPYIAILLYVSSFVGDLVDGMIARKLSQTSEFGGLLDMVTDRCSTLGLLFVLGCTKYYTKLDTTLGFPIYKLTFLVLTLLDISSHWCQMYSTSKLNLHHKSDSGNADRNFLVRWFYHYYYFFGYLCVGAEFTYILLYLLPHLEKENMDSNGFYHTVAKYALYGCVPGCVMKQAVNVMQLLSACYAVAKHDADSNNKNK